MKASPRSAPAQQAREGSSEQAREGSSERAREGSSERAREGSSEQAREGSSEQAREGSSERAREAVRASPPRPRPLGRMRAGRAAAERGAARETLGKILPGNFGNQRAKRLSRALYGKPWSRALLYVRKPFVRVSVC